MLAIGAALSFLDFISGSHPRLWILSGAVEAVILGLERDPQDYAGHKTAAIQALRQARADLGKAIREAMTSPPPPGAPDLRPETLPRSPSSSAHPMGPGSQRRETAAERRLRAALRVVGAVISLLEDDPQDYSGHKAAAVQDLLRAAQELEQAAQLARQAGPQPLAHGRR
jgi:hypothetical protein